MKKIFYIIYMLLGICLYSCNKQLTQLPTNEITTANYWNTANDALLALNGCYASVWLYAYDYWYFDGASDNEYAQYSWESGSTYIAAGNINAATVDGIYTDYSQEYVYIHRFNEFLENIHKVDMDSDLKNQYIGEVEFLRAFSYYLLTEMYGDVPLVTSSTVSDTALAPVSESNIEDFVIKQLDSASQLLPVDPTNLSHASKGAALALKARVELAYSDWKDAAEDAKAVMDMNKYTLFKLSSLSSTDSYDDYSRFVTFNTVQDSIDFYLGLRSYQEQYYKSNESANEELIFVSQYVANTSYQYNPEYTNGLNSIMLPSALGGWSSLDPTKSLLDAYWNLDGSYHSPTDNVTMATLYNYPNTPSTTYYNDFKNRDPRFYASIFFTGNEWNEYSNGYSFTWVKGGSNNSQTGYNFRKLVDPAYSSYPEFVGGQDFPLIRYAEVLLTYAEAENEVAGPNQSVYDALNLIRERVDMPDIDQSKYNAQTTLRDVIHNERRIELASEGFRYMDIRRWGIAADVMTSVYDVTNSLAQTRSWESEYAKLPYPQTAVDRNPKLKDAQVKKGY